MKYLRNLFLILFTTAFLMPAQVFACACCAERGDYFKHETDFKDFMQDEVAKISLGSAVLFSDAGYPETIKGIDPLGDTFSVKSEFEGSVWDLEFTDNESRKAVLSLWRPSKVENFGVDIEPLSERTTVTLYKEFRLKYRVRSATGFLENGIDSETEFNLVLQGRGNGCLMASDFSTYILQITGANASYRFYGKINITEDTAMQSRGDDAGVRVANKP